MKLTKLLAGLLAVLCLATTPASATIWDWSQTAGSNGNSDSTINWLEGQAPSTINNSARAMMSVIANWLRDTSGVLLTTSGSANIQTLSSNGSAPSLVNGWQICALIGAGLNNTGAATLNVDAYGAKAIQTVSGTALNGGELAAGTIKCFVYSTSATAWILRDGLLVAGGLDNNGPGLERAALTGDVTAPAGSNATTIAAGAVTGSKIATNTITNTNIAQLNGVSILGNATGSTANVGAVTAGSDNTVLNRAGGTLQFGQVTGPMIANGAVGPAQLSSGVGTLPVGGSFEFTGSSCPTLSYLANGQALSRTTYSALYAIEGTTFGAGNGTTTFNIPDETGRVVAGLEASDTRLTSGGSGMHGGTLGNAGGAQNEVLTQGNLPSGVNLASSSLTFSDGSILENGVVVNTTTGNNTNMQHGGGFTAITSVNVTFNSATPSIGGSVPLGGSSTPVTTVQPTIVLLKCIYAGV